MAKENFDICIGLFSSISVSYANQFCYCFLYSQYFFTGRAIEHRGEEPPPMPLSQGPLPPPYATKINYTSLRRLKATKSRPDHYDHTPLKNPGSAPGQLNLRHYSRSARLGGCGGIPTPG